MSSFALKIFACAVMLADHIGYVFMDKGLAPQTYIMLRIIGRAAFPVFAFMAAEGCLKTHDRTKYLFRMFCAGILSEIAFDLMCSGTAFDIGHQNVMFTLFLGIAASAVYSLVRSALGNGFLGAAAGFLPAAVLIAAGAFVRSDYGWQGAAAVFIIYLAGERKGVRILASAAACILTVPVFSQTAGITVNGLQLFCIGAIIPLCFYNGTRGAGGKIAKYGFYVFYPAHMLMLWLLHIAV